MEKVLRGVTFKNVLRTNEKLTEQSFSLLCSLFEVNYKKYKKQTFYIVEGVNFWNLQDTFGDLTLYSVHKEELISKHHLLLHKD